LKEIEGFAEDLSVNRSGAALNDVGRAAICKTQPASIIALNL
jgi:hypothetical protein